MHVRWLAFLTIVCNLDDNSWGTKGQEKAAHEQSKAKNHDAGSSEETRQVHITECLNSISPTKVKNKRKEKKREYFSDWTSEEKKDYFAALRTYFVLFWFGLNALIIVLFTNESIKNSFGVESFSKPYLTVTFPLIKCLVCLLLGRLFFNCPIYGMLFISLGTILGKIKV
jgi:hypothetical protein